MGCVGSAILVIVVIFAILTVFVQIPMLGLVHHYVYSGALIIIGIVDLILLLVFKENYLAKCAAAGITCYFAIAIAAPRIELGFKEGNLIEEASEESPFVALVDGTLFKGKNTSTYMEWVGGAALIAFIIFALTYWLHIIKFIFWLLPTTALIWGTISLFIGLWKFR